MLFDFEGVSVAAVFLHGNRRFQGFSKAFQGVLGSLVGVPGVSKRFLGISEGAGGFKGLHIRSSGFYRRYRGSSGFSKGFSGITGGLQEHSKNFKGRSKGF